MFLKASEEFLDINFPNQHGLTPLMLAVRDVDLFESLDMLTVYRPAEVLSELLRHRAWVRVTSWHQWKGVYAVVVTEVICKPRHIDCFFITYIKCTCTFINRTSLLQSDIQMLDVAISYSYDIDPLFYLLTYLFFW